MSLPPVIGSKGLWFHSNSESSRSAILNKAVIGEYTVTSLRAKVPPSIENKTCLKGWFTQAKPLSESTRSIHTLFDLQRRRVDAAALALESLDKKTSSLVLKNISLQLDPLFLAKEDRPATRSELNAVKHLDKDLLDIIARQLRQSGLPPKDALKMAQRAFYCANQELLNVGTEIKRGERNDSPLKSDSAGNNRMKNRIFLAEGSRGQVHKLDEQVVKTFVDFDCMAVEHELSMCNEYAKINKQTLPAAYINGRELFMPYIHGSIPMGSEVRDAVRELFDLGLMMGDPRPDNFVKIEGGRIVPIDFGLMFKVGNELSIPQCVKREIVYDYIKGGYKFIPTSLKTEYISVMKSIDVSLGEESPVGHFNVKKLMASGWLILGDNKRPGYSISGMRSTT